MRETVKATFKSPTTQNTTNSKKDGKLKSYCEPFNNHLKKYATDEIISTAENYL